jgi:hypothetical protein
MQLDSSAARRGAGPSRIPAELESFFVIADRWKLSTDDQIVLLGSPGRSTFFKWKKDGGTLPADTRERLSHILGIWKSLRILFTQDDRGEAWVRAKNRYFDGASALDVMLEGMSGVIRVRTYLDTQRGA